MHLEAANLTATNVVFGGRAAGTASAGIEMALYGAALTLTDVTFGAMSLASGASGGAAINSMGTVKLTRVTATAGGSVPSTAKGGFMRMYTGSLLMDDCTIAGFS